MKTMLKYWLFTAIIVTGLCGLLYATVQQVLRQDANDPQIQMAEDSAVKLANGQQVQNVVPSENIDIANSLAPYIIVFDVNGKPVASSGQLNGQSPTIPAGVFDYVRHNGEDRFTWQPRPSIRSAIVVTQVKGPHPGFVLAGRSLREVEKREDDTMQVVLLGWISMLFVTFLATAMLFFRRSSKEPVSVPKME